MFIFVCKWSNVCKWFGNGMVMVRKGLPYNNHIYVIYMSYNNHISIKIYDI